MPIKWARSLGSRRGKAHALTLRYSRSGFVPHTTLARYCWQYCRQALVAGMPLTPPLLESGLEVMGN
jgi:hypothetical protein